MCCRPKCEADLTLVSISDQLWYCDVPCGLSVPLLSPGNLRVSEEWYNRFRVTWDPPPSPTAGYRIVYQPINGTRTHTHTLAETNANPNIICINKQYSPNTPFGMTRIGIMEVFIVFVYMFMIIFDSVSHTGTHTHIKAQLLSNTWAYFDCSMCFAVGHKLIHTY